MTSSSSSVVAFTERTGWRITIHVVATVAAAAVIALGAWVVAIESRVATNELHIVDIAGDMVTMATTQGDIRQRVWASQTSQATLVAQLDALKEGQRVIRSRLDRLLENRSSTP